MDIAVGDTILTRKKHPCGASSFEVLRVGMDFKIRCTGCGREVMLPRAKIEKNIKKVATGIRETADELIAALRAVTNERIAEAAQSMTLDTVYFLTGEDSKDE